MKESNEVTKNIMMELETVLAEGHGKQFIHNQVSDRYYLKVKPAVAVLINIGDKFLVRTQDRSFSEDVTWELFVRGIQEGESAGNAVINLVSEVTGMEVSYMDKLVKLYTSPNNIDEKFFLYSVVLSNDGMEEEYMINRIKQLNKNKYSVHVIDINTFVDMMTEGQSISSTLINAIFLNSFLPSANK